MKTPRKAPTEVICLACDGTGFQKVKQLAQPGRKIYPPEMHEMSRQRPNKEASRNLSWIDPRPPSMRASTIVMTGQGLEQRQVGPPQIGGVGRGLN
jgi:hypothetical protein